VFQCQEGLSSGSVTPLLPAKRRATGAYLPKKLLKLFESTSCPPFLNGICFSQKRNFFRILENNNIKCGRFVNTQNGF
jgi:hypothetical protein